MSVVAQKRAFCKRNNRFSKLNLPKDNNACLLYIFVFPLKLLHTGVLSKTLKKLVKECFHLADLCFSF